MSAFHGVRWRLNAAVSAALLLLASSAVAAQTPWRIESAVGLPMDRAAGHSTGWRVSAGAEVPLGDHGCVGGLLLGFAAFGDTAEGPLVQRNHRHTSGPSVGLQVALPVLDGWQVRARVGLGYWQTVLRTTVNGAEAFQATEHHVGPLLGAGLAWQWSPALALTASVDVGQHRFDGLPTVRPALWALGLSTSF
ncbi:hypothetical protein [Sphaerotilus sp.]|uniref:hypothetical protein n=1 Tax=Sphaerotilus sp. TaxID=2093942 RepID=UPI0034E249DF